MIHDGIFTDYICHDVINLLECIIEESILDIRWLVLSRDLEAKIKKTEF